MSKKLTTEENFNNQIFARMLKRAIKEKGVSHEELAIQICKTRNTISQLCIGSRLTSVPTLIAMCNALGITPDYLLGPYLTDTTQNSNENFNKLYNYIFQLKENEVNAICQLIEVMIHNRG